MEAHRRQHQSTEDWSAALDMKAASMMLGLGGRFHTQGSNCIHCHIHSSDLHVFETNRVHHRARQELWWCAHLPDPQASVQTRFPFTCPGCGQSFHSQEQIDSDIPTVSEKQYREQHWSTSHHQGPLLDVEPSKVYICCLHLLLSITKVLFNLSVRLHIHTAQQARVVNTLMEELDIEAPTITPITKSTKSVGKPLSFTGAECVRVLKNIHRFLSAVFVKDPKRIACHMEVFELFVIVYDLIRKRFDPNEQQLQAQLVRNSAVEFVKQFTRVFANKNVNYYIHALVHHVPDQIASCPVRFFNCSGHAIEMMNNSLKRMTR